MSTLAELAAAHLHLVLTAEQEKAFDRYAAELIAWNARVNLTAILDPNEIRIRHFLDSLTIAAALDLPPGLRIIDVGTGAGFPGIPLQIVRPELRMTLLEATGKKVAYLQHMIDCLALSGASALKGRAEEIGQLVQHRQQYGLALARAVARLPVLLEYLLPLVRVGGQCVAMKGRTAHQELEDSDRALSQLGGRLNRVETFRLPGVEEDHHLIVVDKVASTSLLYPRRPGLPAQKPL